MSDAPDLSADVPAVTRSTLLAASGLTKRFGGQLALDHVDLVVQKASVHAIAGENGAGKSTLIKILAGIHRPDEGVLSINGVECVIREPREASAYGIGFVHQHLHLVPTLSVRENMLLTASFPTRGRTRIDWKETDAKASKYLDLVGLTVSLRTKVGELGVAQQQLVAFARALLQEPEIIVLDEPTASLGRTETEHLLEIIRQRQATGATFIFVTHRLDEILAVSDTVTVLKDGRLVATVETASLTRRDLVHMLGGAAGHDDGQSSRRARTRAGAPLLEGEGLRVPGFETATDFHLDRGEVIGLAGLVGSGRTTLANILTGGASHVQGTLRVDGEAVVFHNREAALRHGIVLAPAERSHAIVSDFGIPENISLGHVDRFAWKGVVLNKRRERIAAARWVTKLEIRAGKGDRRLRYLSGGNQRKVVLARALDLQPRLLVLDEPTAGVDIATKEYIYGLVRELATSGMTILFISSDLDELPLVSDRILIFQSGRVVDELPGNASRAAVVARLFATGSAEGERMR